METRGAKSAAVSSPSEMKPVATGRLILVADRLVADLLVVEDRLGVDRLTLLEVLETDLLLEPDRLELLELHVEPDRLEDEDCQLCASRALMLAKLNPMTVIINVLMCGLLRLFLQLNSGL